MALHELASFKFPASTYMVQTHCPDHNFNFHHPLSLWKYYSRCSVVISTPISSSQINLPWRYYLSESLFYVVFYVSNVLFYRFPFFSFLFLILVLFILIWIFSLLLSFILCCLLVIHSIISYVGHKIEIHILTLTVSLISCQFKGFRMFITCHFI